MSKKIWLRTAGFACAATCATWALPAHATNGYFANGFDVDSKAMAGAGLTTGDGPVAASNNPALGLKVGNTIGGCLGLFLPDRSVDSKGGTGNQPNLVDGKYKSENDAFLIPCFGGNKMMAPDTSLGLLVYANGGMNTSYKTNVFKTWDAGLPAGYARATEPLGANLEQAFIGLNAAHDFGSGVALGAQPIVAVQRFRAYGLQDWATSSIHPDKLTNNGDSYSVGGGFKVGGLWDVNKWLSLGATYQSEMLMTKFDKYAGLFAGEGKFNIPAYISEGIKVKPVQSLDVLVEHQHIFYSTIPSLANTGSLTAGTGTGNMNLGSENGGGFGWNDMDVVRLGLQWDAAQGIWGPKDKLTLRAGYSHATDFTDHKEIFFNVLAPATVKDHASVGFSYDINENWEIDASYVHAFQNNFTGKHPTYSQNQSTTLSLEEDEINIGLQYRW